MTHEIDVPLNSEEVARQSWHARTVAAELSNPPRTPMTQHPDQLDLEGLESAAKAALRPETWAGTGIPGMSLNPTTVVALLSRLRASEAECAALADLQNEHANITQAWRDAEALATSQAEIIKGLSAALEPFSTMADAMDDAEGLIDDEDLRDHADLIFGGMSMGDWPRDDFRRAQAALASTRSPAGSDEEVGT